MPHLGCRNIPLHVPQPPAVALTTHPTTSPPEWRLRLLGRVVLDGPDHETTRAVLQQPKRLAVLTYLMLREGFVRPTPSGLVFSLTMLGFLVATLWGVAHSVRFYGGVPTLSTAPHKVGPPS